MSEKAKTWVAALVVAAMLSGISVASPALYVLIWCGIGFLAIAAFSAAFTAEVLDVVSRNDDDE